MLEWRPVPGVSLSGRLHGCPVSPAPPSSRSGTRKGISFCVRLLVSETDLAVNVYVAAIQAADVIGETFLITNQLSFIPAVASPAPLQRGRPDRRTQERGRHRFSPSIALVGTLTLIQVAPRCQIQCRFTPVDLCTFVQTCFCL